MRVAGSGDDDSVDPERGQEVDHRHLQWIIFDIVTELYNRGGADFRRVFDLQYLAIYHLEYAPPRCLFSLDGPQRRTYALLHGAACRVWQACRRS